MHTTTTVPTCDDTEMETVKPRRNYRPPTEWTGQTSCFMKEALYNPLDSCMLKALVRDDVHEAHRLRCEEGERVKMSDLYSAAYFGCVTSVRYVIEYCTNDVRLRQESMEELINNSVSSGAIELVSYLVEEHAAYLSEQHYKFALERRDLRMAFHLMNHNTPILRSDADHFVRLASDVCTPLQIETLGYRLARLISNLRDRRRRVGRIDDASVRSDDPGAEEGSAHHSERESEEPENYYENVFSDDPGDFASP
jgi:hypothetical protein